MRIDYPPAIQRLVAQLKSLIQRHLKRTGSQLARRLLLNWSREQRHFVKVFPHEYKRALQQAAAVADINQQSQAEAEAVAAALSVNGELLCLLCSSSDAGYAAQHLSLGRHNRAACSSAGTGKDSGLDAFEMLKKAAASADIKNPPKALRLPVTASGNGVADKSALVTAALKGLPVSAFPATWESDRPDVVPEGNANKVGAGCCLQPAALSNVA